VDGAGHFRVRARRLAAIVTFAPSRAARKRMARPISRLAPVMNRVFPRRDMASFHFESTALCRSHPAATLARRSPPGYVSEGRPSVRRGCTHIAQIFVESPKARRRAPQGRVPEMRMRIDQSRQHDHVIAVDYVIRRASIFSATLTIFVPSPRTSPRLRSQSGNPRREHFHRG
jgi:hypothetical protein